MIGLFSVNKKTNYRNHLYLHLNIKIVNKKYYSLLRRIQYFFVYSRM